MQLRHAAPEGRRQFGETMACEVGFWPLSQVLPGYDGSPLIKVEFEQGCWPAPPRVFPVLPYLEGSAVL